MSLGRHAPPNPRPGRRTRVRCAGRRQGSATDRITSASAASQTSDMALMKGDLRGEDGLAATLASSAVGRSVVTKGTPSARGLRIDRPERRLGAWRLHPYHDPVRTQRVFHGVALAQEFRIPGKVHRLPGRGQPCGVCGQLRPPYLREPWTSPPRDRGPEGAEPTRTRKRPVAVGRRRWRLDVAGCPRRGSAHRRKPRHPHTR